MVGSTRGAERSRGNKVEGDSFPEDPDQIDLWYMLITHIPFYIDHNGSILVEHMWCLDLDMHLRYLPRFILAAPRLADLKDARDMSTLTIPKGCELKIIEIPQGHVGKLGQLTNLPRAFFVLWNAVKGADIVQPGTIAWPITWIGSAIALLRRRGLVIVVEGSPWRVLSPGVARKVYSYISEMAIRFFVNHASISFFTQPSYMESLLTARNRTGFVVPASWIEDKDVLTENSAIAAWFRKKQRTKRRFLFAARLVEDKGVRIVLEAAETLARDGANVQIDIIGDGPLRPLCADAVAGGIGSDMLRLLAPVSYGREFFSLVADYDCVIVPSLGEEQPRIVFDAYSQAVPVLASDTDGLRPLVQVGHTGWLFRRGSAGDLVAAVAMAAAAENDLASMGVEALAVARQNTHEAMHRTRWRALAWRFSTGRR